ncbi:MAG TPA: MBOAT family O-acyltransferase, partial [Planctomycetota bacterium]|nr:MBOAT family O-acyltransferase [Planctomycetota bacterium]
AVAVVYNLGLLVFFKYGDWFWSSFGGALHALGLSHTPLPPLAGLFGEQTFLRTALTTPDGHLRLPLGISFFTFQAFSYVIDIYRRDGRVQHNPINFALYKSLFPQLIAGPIVRYKDVDEQITSRQTTFDGFAYGVRRFVLGLGKKMLVANAAAEVADKIFNSHDALPTPVAWLGILAYTIQIYFDFSGYSDMAIGLGRMFGFRFLENFDHPYVARSVTEFWRRWHISLSTWFRDYLYIPLGGNRGSAQRTYFNLVLVFFLCGLWHGASTTFVVWGLYHGMFLVLERLGLGRWLGARHAAIRHVYLLLVVMLGWVFFRAENMPRAFAFLSALAGAGAAPATMPLGLFLDPRIALALACGVIGSIPWLPALQAWSSRRMSAGRVGVPIALEAVGLGLLVLVLVASSLELASNSYNPFIYFRF